jgi:hypothetical protein
VSRTSGRDAGPRAGRRPGWLWLLFFGRRRRGFPGLLVGLVAAALALGALFGLPHGADLSAYVIPLAIGVLVLLILASIALVAIAAVRPPRRGRR